MGTESPEYSMNELNAEAASILREDDGQAAFKFVNVAEVASVGNSN